MVTVSEETAVDYELTAKIATDAFAAADVQFSADRIKWLYERSFGRGTNGVIARPIEQHVAFPVQHSRWRGDQGRIACVLVRDVSRPEQRSFDGVGQRNDTPARIGDDISCHG